MDWGVQSENVDKSKINEKGIDTTKDYDTYETYNRLVKFGDHVLQ